MNSDRLPAIKGLIESTLLDWEGRLAAEVFLAGCNFRCPFCHARHLVLGADALESVPLDSVDACLARNEGWTDGVVISGGEPTRHAGLRGLITHFRQKKVSGTFCAQRPKGPSDKRFLTPFSVLGIKLDTNGSAPDVLERLIADGLLDAVAMDVKAPLDERYHEAAGVRVDLDAIRASIELLIRSDIEYEFRTTVCPRFHDADAIEQTALAVRGAKRYVLQRFRPLNCIDPSLNELQPCNDDQMRAFADLARKYVAACHVRGDSETSTG